MKGTMKSIFRITTALLLPLLLWTGCGREAMPTTGIPDHCIEITLGGLHPALTAKASSRGADAYNENLVESVDCFFYTNGGTGSNAVFSALGRGADAVAEGDSTVYKVKVFFTDADAIKMFGNKNSGTCELFVICNAPLSYDMAHSSVAELKELVVENDFTAQTVQRSFVMSADEIATVTLTTDGNDNRTATGRIEVSRASAKIQFFLLIPDVFEDESHQMWEPVLDAGIGISLSNAVKKGKVDGDYTVQAADYVNYGSRAVTELAAGDRIAGHEQYKYTHVPFYSYPCAWSDLSDYATTVVFRIPWRIVGETDYQWKKYQLSPNVSTLDLKRNKYYRTFVKVSSLGGADKESLVIIPDCDYEIIPWMNESTTGGGQGVVPGEFVTYKYLVVDHPEQTIFNETTAYFTFVSSSPIYSVAINSVDYYDNTQINPEQTQNVNRTVTADEETVSTQAGNITVNKSNPGYITLYHSLDDMYSSITIHVTITNEDGCTQEVEVEQNPSIRLVRESEASGNMFINGHFSWVRNATFGTSYGTLRISNKNYNFSTYYHSNQGYNSSYYITNNGTGGYGNIGSHAFNLRSGGNSTVSQDYFTTNITVTSFNESNNTYTVNSESVNYRIGDPRVKASSIYPDFSLNPYLKNETGNQNTAVTEAWSSPGDILICSQAEDDRNIVSPHFLVSSGLTELLVGQIPETFLAFVKRGASFQEAGYPAGRWRLPTEAEVAFIAARQADGTIPDIFNRDVPYYCASGRWVIIPSSGTNLTFGTDVNQQIRVWNSNYYIYQLLDAKFVYDLWYWGDEPSTTNVYHPNGHLYEYDSAGNATLIR